MKRKPLSGLARLLKSHLRLLRVQRGQIKELGHLRVSILHMREQVSALREIAQANRELLEIRPPPDSPELIAQKQRVYADMFRMPP